MELSWSGLLKINLFFIIMDDLPFELIHLIARFLSPRDLYAFKCISKYFNNSISPREITRLNFGSFLNPPAMWGLNTRGYSHVQLKKYSNNMKDYIQYLINNHSALNSYITTNLDGGYSMIREYYPLVNYRMCKDSLWNVTFNRTHGLTRIGKTCIYIKLHYIYDFSSSPKKSIELEIRKIYHSEQWELQIYFSILPTHSRVVGRSLRTIIRRIFRILKNTYLSDFVPDEFEKQEDESYFLSESKKLMNDITFPLWPLFLLIYPQ